MTLVGKRWRDISVADIEAALEDADHTLSLIGLPEAARRAAVTERNEGRRLLWEWDEAKKKAS